MKSKVFVLEVLEDSSRNRMAIVRSQRGTAVAILEGEAFVGIDYLDLDNSEDTEVPTPPPHPNSVTR